MPEYLPRIVDRELELRLEASGATLIVGPKWCGKTTTGEQKAKSILKMQDPDKKDGYLATAAAKPSLLLKGENPRLIDEWQIAPVLWDAVRTAVDQRQEDGLFILTGSTSVDDKNIMHTGACTNLGNPTGRFHCETCFRILRLTLMVFPASFRLSSSFLPPAAADGRPRCGERIRKRSF